MVGVTGEHEVSCVNGLWRCTCHDYTYRGVGHVEGSYTCKHILAVVLDLFETCLLWRNILNQKTKPKRRQEKMIYEKNERNYDKENVKELYAHNYNIVKAIKDINKFITNAEKNMEFYKTHTINEVLNYLLKKYDLETVGLISKKLKVYETKEKYEEAKEKWKNMDLSFIPESERPNFEKFPVMMVNQVYYVYFPII